MKLKDACCLEGNIQSIFKSRYITLLGKVPEVKAMVFPLVMYGYANWTLKKVEYQRIDSFEVWCWRKLLLFSRVWLFVTPWTAAHQASLSSATFQSLFKLMSIELGMPSKHLVLCHPFLWLPSIFPSIKAISNWLALCIRWLMYWSYTISISLSNECSGFLSFRTDWFDLLAVQVTLKSLLQPHSTKASILQCSAFIMVHFTSVHNNWKNQSLDSLQLHLQSNVFDF